MKLSTVLILLLTIAVRGYAAEDPQSNSDRGLHSVQQLISRYCLDCHSKGSEAAAEVSLTGWPALPPEAQAPLPQQAARDSVQLYDRVLRAVQFGHMPPADASQPTAAERNQLLLQLQIQQQNIASQLPAVTTQIRRMNRFQYNNAVRDLLELKVEVFPLSERILREYGDYFQPESGLMPESVTVGCRPLGKSQMIESCLSGVTPFPQDLRAENGFDNRADHLSLSPLLLESFLRLARSIVHSTDFTPRNSAVLQRLIAAPADHSPPALRQQISARLQPLLRKAFRGATDAATEQRYTGYAEQLLQEGLDFPIAMRETLAAVLSSPSFFYLASGSTAAQGSHRPGDWALAERLALFLWNSIPDDELLDLAAADRLHQPDLLAGQVQRMLRDRRVKRFADSFPSQWLQLERIIPAEPDREQFPQFYFLKYRASMHMVLEPLLLFETVLVEDRPLTDLLAPDFSYRSNLLQAWYRDGTQGSPGSPVKVQFDRVRLQDQRYGGVISNAAVMTMTSAALETKPIARGAWMAAVILNDPPPPPPADVPPLPAGAEAAASLTIRQRFAVHRERSDCRSCHDRIDPLGFALENYGPTGIWRDQYAAGQPVNASGLLFGRHQFTDFPELREALLLERELFAEAFVRHLLAYALCRELTAQDSPGVREIVSSTAGQDFRIQAVIQAIALSPLFREATEPVQAAQWLPQQPRRISQTSNGSAAAR